MNRSTLKLRRRCTRLALDAAVTTPGASTRRGGAGGAHTSDTDTISFFSEVDKTADADGNDGNAEPNAGAEEDEVEAVAAAAADDCRRSTTRSHSDTRVKRRKLNLKAKFEGDSSYYSFKRLAPDAVNVGLKGSTCTAVPGARLGWRP